MDLSEQKKADKKERDEQKEATKKDLYDWGLIQKKDKGGRTSWYARIVRFEPNGKKKQYTEKADNKSHARRLRDELIKKYEDRGEKAIAVDKMTFRELVAIFTKKKLIAAVYHGEGDNKRKVAGLRSLGSAKRYTNIVNDYFGNKLIRAITHADLEEFKTEKLKENTVRDKPRSISDVNRHLAQMRIILKFAVRNEWLARSPFELGDPLISLADEVKRDRTLTAEEEKRLLAACEGERTITYKRYGKEITATIKVRRDVLKSFLILAFDTAMRKGELLKLQWKEVDFTSRLITVLETNSKTQRRRRIGMTQRVCDELLRLWNQSPQDFETLVFNVTDLKKSFRLARSEAGLEDFRFHDARHTAITRMVGTKHPHLEIMKISGHTQMTTFARYVNPDTQTIQTIADSLSNYNREMSALSESKMIH